MIGHGGRRSDPPACPRSPEVARRDRVAGPRRRRTQSRVRRAPARTGPSRPARRDPRGSVRSDRRSDCSQVEGLARGSCRSSPGTVDGDQGRRRRRRTVLCSTVRRPGRPRSGRPSPPGCVGRPEPARPAARIAEHAQRHRRTACRSPSWRAVPSGQTMQVRRDPPGRGRREGQGCPVAAEAADRPSRPSGPSVQELSRRRWRRSAAGVGDRGSGSGRRRCRSSRRAAGCSRRRR